MAWPVIAMRGLGRGPQGEQKGLPTLWRKNVFEKGGFHRSSQAASSCSMVLPFSRTLALMSPMKVLYLARRIFRQFKQRMVDRSLRHKSSGGE
jgi:hypothetical protein